MSSPKEAGFLGKVFGKGWPRNRLTQHHALTDFEIQLTPRGESSGSNALLRTQCDGENLDEVNFFQFDDLLAFGFAVEALSDLLMITPQSWPEMNQARNMTSCDEIDPKLKVVDDARAYLVAECRGIAKLRDRLRVGGEWVEFEVQQRPSLEGDVTRPSCVSVIVRADNVILFDIPVFDADALSAFCTGVRLVCAMVTINPTDF